MAFLHLRFASLWDSELVLSRCSNSDTSQEKRKYISPFREQRRSHCLSQSDLWSRVSTFTGVAMLSKICCLSDVVLRWPTLNGVLEAEVGVLNGPEGAVRREGVQYNCLRFHYNVNFGI